MQKISFRNAEGRWNSKLIAGLISLLLVLVQQLLTAFNIKVVPAELHSTVAIINTILTILGMLGVITDVQLVTTPTDLEDENLKVAAKANEVAKSFSSDKMPKKVSQSKPDTATTTKILKK
ncbi:phage holin [Lactiplantibacillus sp. DA1]|uniref:phage holin n=1 Tax=Lactiplantibacillus sp. DA1 TaxID=3079857 RepID=UPI00292A5E8B|nr:phage holin [Lactiplantibacillus sp. DA1]MDV0431344.1 phage holin [Lactiplantibacillus sp. DA1]